MSAIVSYKNHIYYTFNVPAKNDICRMRSRGPIGRKQRAGARTKSDKLVLFWVDKDKSGALQKVSEFRNCGEKKKIRD